MRSRKILYSQKALGYEAIYKIPNADLNKFSFYFCTVYTWKNEIFLSNIVHEPGEI